MQTQDEIFMKEALRQAQKAAAIDEVPIGCVIVQNDRIIARGYNRRNTDHNVLSHAELAAMKKAVKKTGDWRLEDCTLYVTLEPCQMCAGAIVQARVKRVVCGAMNAKAGCAGSVINLLQMKQFNHQVELTTGVCGEECADMLSTYFKQLRDRKEIEHGQEKMESEYRITAPSQPADLHPDHIKASLHGKRRKKQYPNYKIFLWDVDGTLLNFLEAEKAALRKCFEIHGLGELTDDMLARYSAINRKYWEALERGELTKPEVLVGRYREFFTLEGLDVSKAEAVNGDYQVLLGDTCVFYDDGYHIVERLKGRVLQYAVTNGTTTAQTRKLANSGLGELFDGVFISDLIGHEKPSPEFFDAVFSRLPPGIRKEEILIIGDSLTSDIRGGNNAGIDTCWYNPRKKPNDKGVTVTYEITNLHQVLPLAGRPSPKDSQQGQNKS